MLLPSLTQALHELQHALNNQLASSPNAKIAHALRSLHVEHVSEILYFTVSKDPTEEHEVLHLTEIVAPQATEGINQAKGRRIRFAQTQMYFTPISSEAMVVAPGNHGQAEINELQRQLGVFDKTRVNVRIFCGSSWVGLLTLAIPPRVADSEKQAYRFFAEQAGAILSNFWSSYISAKKKEFAGYLSEQTRNLNPYRDFDKHCEAFLRAVRRTLRGCTAALFAYNPYKNRVVRIAEDTVARVALERMDEIYAPGTHGALTGLAFESERWRLICDLEVFHQSDFLRAKINWPSFWRHERAGVRPTSVLYSAVSRSDMQGKNRPLFLVRLINREDTVRPYFAIRDKILLDDFAAQFAGPAQTMVLARRWGRLAQIQALAAREPGNLQRIFEEIASLLRVEGCEHPFFSLVEWHPAQPANSLVTRIIGPDPEATELLKVLGLAPQDPFLAGVIQDRTVTSTSFDVLQGKSKERDLAIAGLLSRIFPVPNETANGGEQVRRPGRGHVLLVRGEGKTHLGVLAAVFPDEDQRPSADIEGRLQRSHVESLKTCASILTAVGETELNRYRYLTAQEFVTNAKELVQVVGHELTSPINNLGQSALELVAELQDLQSFSKTGKVDELHARLASLSPKDLEAAVASFLTDASRTVRDASDLALDRTSEIKLNVRQLRLGDVFATARDHVNKEYVAVNKIGNRIQVEIDHNQALTDLPEIQGDPTLLLKAFINLLSNAVKYSISPGQGRPIRVRAHGQNQKGWQIVQFTNWGIPLPHDRRELIFDAFRRGDVEDPHQVRRGLGIGLYMSKRYIAAHGGLVRCVRSEPTLDNPNRRNVEGWETTFEIRIPIPLPRELFRDH